MNGVCLPQGKSTFGQSHIQPHLSSLIARASSIFAHLNHLRAMFRLTVLAAGYLKSWNDGQRRLSLASGACLPTTPNSMQIYSSSLRKPKSSLRLASFCLRENLKTSAILLQHLSLLYKASGCEPYNPSQQEHVPEPHLDGWRARQRPLPYVACRMQMPWHSSSRP